MNRYGLGILLVAGTAGAIALQGCSSDSTDTPTPPTGTGGTGAGGGGNAGTGGGAAGTSECTKGSPPNYGAPGSIPAGCTGACCPSSASCYSAAAGKTAPGAECLATQDNTGKTHIQMRQQWITAVTPVGNTVPLVYSVLSGRTQLPWKTCNQSGVIGSGGYIQVIDFFLGGTDHTKHYSTVGFAKYVPGPATGVDPATFVPTDVLTNGFCMGTEQYAGDPKYQLDESGMTPSDAFPPGLPHPMPLKAGPWTVAPTKAKRLDTDFDVCTSRKDFLAKLDKTGEYGSQGYTGVFYFDDATGSAHGFGALGWVVVYDATGATHIVVPIREVETRSKFNNKDAPNCVGVYNAGAIDPSTCQGGQDPKSGAAWGGGDCGATTGQAACKPGEAAASTVGYFLISELEQIYAPDLQVTLCVSYPGNDTATSTPNVDKDGFYDKATSSCVTSKWNPKAPNNAGIPKGDWCAATNSAATDSCHDAWRSVSYHVFAGAKIKLDTASDAPATCPF